MLKQTCERIDDSVIVQPQKSSVWRDGVMALVASLGVGILAASVLTAVVFVITTIAVG